MALLAARSPQLHRALAAAKAGHAFVVLDGTLIPIDRVAADRPFYSGKHHRHGMNLQVIASPDGEIVWVSGPCPAGPCSVRGQRHADRVAWGLGSAMLEPTRQTSRAPHPLALEPTYGSFPAAVPPTGYISAKMPDGIRVSAGTLVQGIAVLGDGQCYESSLKRIDASSGGTKGE